MITYETECPFSFQFGSVLNFLYILYILGNIMYVWVRRSVLVLSLFLFPVSGGSAAIQKRWGY